MMDFVITNAPEPETKRWPRWVGALIIVGGSAIAWAGLAALGRLFF